MTRPLEELPPVDIDQWATEALSDASIELLAEKDVEQAMSFATSLGGWVLGWDVDLVLEPEGIEIGED